MIRLLAVLLGVVLLWPALGPTLAQPSQPALACADRGAGPVGKPEQTDIQPSEASEAEDSEVEDSFAAPRSLAPPPELSGCGVTRMAAPSHEHVRISTGHDVLARERGPPLS